MQSWHGEDEVARGFQLLKVQRFSFHQPVVKQKVLGGLAPRNIFVHAPLVEKTF